MSAHPESRWTHPQCERCWMLERGEQVPTRLVPEARATEVCCFCGNATLDGIYVRRDPVGLACAGGAAVNGPATMADAE